MTPFQWAQKTSFSPSNVHISNRPPSSSKHRFRVNQSRRGLEACLLNLVRSAAWAYCPFRACSSALFSIPPCGEELRPKAFAVSSALRPETPGVFRERAFPWPPVTRAPCGARGPGFESWLCSLLSARQSLWASVSFSGERRCYNIRLSEQTPCPFPGDTLPGVISFPPVS